MVWLKGSPSGSATSQVWSVSWLTLAVLVWRLLRYRACQLIWWRTTRQGLLLVSVTTIVTVDLLFFAAMLLDPGAEAAGWGFIILPLWHLGVFIGVWWFAASLFFALRAALRQP